ncbi:PREDICTED: THO complex subunit 7 homolog [Priapulus caudatus]|uniref:THO complex subunit 7 homolog n=1 Tax=Priapulus caudatus TaxID=37621 RepID=A0ABM1E602_PRICU|nr:PREDICTED: THO complex subunit 7 homolog [Priapulus caudatus]
MADDDILRKKLLIEGDGTGSDTRINTFLKTFFKWFHGKDAESDEESNAAYQKLLSQLAQIEISHAKTKFIHDMNVQEKKNYERLYTDIEQQIDDARQQIIDCKNELLQAKRIRKNRQEYDVLAKLIQQHPDRQETLNELEALDQQTQSSQKENLALDDKLEMRRKQFHVLMTAIYELTSLLEADDEKKDEDIRMETG